MRPDRATLATWKQRLALFIGQARRLHDYSLFTALALFGFLRLYGGHPVLLPWLLGLIGWNALRLFTAKAWQRRPGRLSPCAWYRLFLAEVFVSGLLWGAIGLYPVTRLPDAMQALPPIALSVTLIAALPGYIPVARLYAGFVAGVTISYGLGIALAQPERFGSALVILVLAAFLLPLAWRFQRDQIRALLARRRERRLLERMRQSNARLREKQALLDREEEVAQHVFRQLTQGNATLEHCATWIRPMGAFSGDLIQMTNGPSGDDYILLGDFTGHGLPAAMGAVPASSVFLAMARKGLPLARIAAELNRKLHELLPTGYFCCAVLIQVSADRRHACIYNAGLPAVLITRRDGRLKHRIDSEQLPLGVIADGHSPDVRPGVMVALEPGDCLYAYSDGLTEAKAPDGGMWGQAPLERLIETPLDEEEGRLGRLREQLLAFIGSAPSSDDIAVVEYRVRRSARNADAA